MVGALGSMLTLTSATNNNSNEAVTVASSNSNSKSTKASDDTLEIWSSWAKGGVQDYALKEIVDVWNAKVEKGDEDMDGMKKVEVYNMTGGYSAVTSAVQLALTNNSIADLPDMYIGYSDVTASLLNPTAFNKVFEGEDMALDLTSTGFDSDQLIPSMQHQNSMIAGADEESIYNIPFATSSELMGIDAPLVVWMLQQYVDQGGTLTVEGEIIKQIFDAADGYKDGSITAYDDDDKWAQGKVIYSPLANDQDAEEVSADDLADIEIGAKDRETIEAQWTVNENGAEGSTLDITDATFDSAEGMMNLATELLKVVNVSEKSLSGIFGYDAPENNFYTYAQAETNSLNNPEDGLLVKDGDDVKIPMLDQGSDQWNEAKKLFDFFKDGYKSGAIWTTTANTSYGSNLLVSHSLPFSIGSTAGATHYYSTNAAEVNGGELVYTQAPGELEAGTNKNVQIQQGPALGAVTQYNNDDLDKGIDTERNEAITGFISWLTGDELTEFETGLSSQTLSYDNWDKFKGLYIDDDGATPLVDAEWPLTEDQMSSDYSDGNLHVKLADEGKEPDYSGGYWAWGSEAAAKAGYAVTPDGTYSPYSGEFYGYWNIGDTGYAVGESSYGLEVFPIVTNEDGTTDLGSYIQVTAPTDAKEETPSVFMSSESGYIVATKATFDDDDYEALVTSSTVQANGTWTDEGTFDTKYGNTSDPITPTLIGPSIAYTNLSEANAPLTSSASTKEDAVTVEMESEPYSIHTDAVRSEVSSQIGKLKTASDNGKKMQDSEDVMISMHNTAVKSGWIEGDLIFVWQWWMTLLVVVLGLTVIGGIAFLVYWLVMRNKNSKNTI